MPHPAVLLSLLVAFVAICIFVRTWLGGPSPTARITDESGDPVEIDDLPEIIEDLNHRKDVMTTATVIALIALAAATYLAIHIPTSLPTIP